jgi:single-strand selective monofunctional uracil DNA glycosylase
VPAVKNWLKLTGKVEKPEKELQIRPILGLDCDKSEQSGQRLWAVLEELFGTAEEFFKHSYIHNVSGF